MSSGFEEEEGGDDDEDEDSGHKDEGCWRQVKGLGWLSCDAEGLVG